MGILDLGSNRLGSTAEYFRARCFAAMLDYGRY